MSCNENMSRICSNLAANKKYYLNDKQCIKPNESKFLTKTKWRNFLKLKHEWNQSNDRWFYSIPFFSSKVFYHVDSILFNKILAFYNDGSLAFSNFILPWLTSCMIILSFLIQLYPSFWTKRSPSVSRH